MWIQLSSVSTIGGGGDTTVVLSLEMAPKQPLPGIGLHDTLRMVGKLAPNPFHFTKGLVK